MGVYNSKKYWIISTLYQQLMENLGKTTCYVKLKWEQELEVKITNDEWLNIWRTQRSSTSSWMWREHCCKNVIRFFITPQITSRCLSNAQPCWRNCGAVHVNHSHVFWLCPEITEFWEKVHSTIVRILGYDVPKSCMFLYHGNIIGDDV